MRNHSIAEWVCVAAVALYLTFALAYIRLPGLEYDEVLFADAALGESDSPLAWRVSLFGHRVPVMLMRYIGALKGWIYAPVFALWGGNPVSVRLPVILAGALSLAAVFAAGLRMAGPKAAAAAVLLLALDPTFLFAGSRDWGPVALSLLLRASAVWLFYVWMQRGSLWPAALMAFALGLGTFDKVIFGWFALALAVAAALCYAPRCRTLLRPRAALTVGAAFALGALPLIAFNLVHPLATFQGRALVTSHFREYLIQRCRMFTATLDGSMVYSLMNLSELDPGAGWVRSAEAGLPGSVAAGLAPLLAWRGTLLPLLFGTALLCIGALWLRTRLKAGRAAAFCLAHMLVIAGFIGVVEEASGPHHMILLYPFVQLLAGISLSEVYRAAGALERPARIALRWGAMGCLAVTLLSQAAVGALYLASFRVYGGAGAWSDAIYELASYARMNPDRKFVLMDWGFRTQLLTLSGGRIEQEEAFGQFHAVPAPERLRRLQPYLADPRALLVFHAPGFETYPLVEWFQEAQRGAAAPLPLIKTFKQRDGRPLYLIWGQSPKSPN